jgi:hypothetical protein
VSTSSQEPIYTITLNDETNTENTVTISSWSADNIPALTTSDIITLTGTDTYNYNYTTSSGTIDLNGIESFNTFNDWFKEEFDGRFPDYDRVMEMCKEYPGLEIAYRKFREVYEMVKEDYDGKQRERRNNR